MTVIVSRLHFGNILKDLALVWVELYISIKAISIHITDKIYHQSQKSEVVGSSPTVGALCFTPCVFHCFKKQFLLAVNRGRCPCTVGNSFFSSYETSSRLTDISVPLIYTCIMIVHLLILWNSRTSNKHANIWQNTYQRWVSVRKLCSVKQWSYAIHKWNEALLSYVEM